MLLSDSNCTNKFIAPGPKNVVSGLKTDLEVRDSKTRNKIVKVEDLFLS
jgi:hypothetical protein